MADGRDQLCKEFDTLTVTPSPHPRPVSPPSRCRQHVERSIQSPVSHLSRLPSRGRLTGKKLFGEPQRNSEQPPAWTVTEESRLIEFMVLFTEGKTWAMHKHTRFWNEARKHFQQCLQTSHCRSGTVHGLSMVRIRRPWPLHDNISNMTWKLLHNSCV